MLGTVSFAVSAVILIVVIVVALADAQQNTTARSIISAAIIISIALLLTSKGTEVRVIINEEEKETDMDKEPGNLQAEIGIIMQIQDAEELLIVAKENGDERLRRTLKDRLHHLHEQRREIQRQA